MANKRVWMALAWLALSAASVLAIFWFSRLAGIVIVSITLAAAGTVWLARLAERALGDGR